MAYDTSYRGSPSSYESLSPQEDFAESRATSSASYIPPYPSQYAPDQVPMPQPRMPSPQRRSPSNTNANSNAQGPLNDSVTSAVNSKTENSDSLAPELISQITATVIQQLQAYGLGNLQGQQPRHQPGPPQPASSYAESPASATERNLHIPPSSENREFDSPSFQNQPAQPLRASPRPIAASATKRRESPSGQHSDISQNDFRPKAPARVSTTSEMTTLEKIWGKLFEDGKPTERLGQFLRGIAVHLIQDYPPGNTIVIVPEKMQKFYEDTKVSSDTYPWHDIFDDHTSSISRLYREVEAEHHLVQQKLNERPDIPGLTPRGFERWITLMIQAHPDREFARLQKAVLDMPISNPDDKKERFPKEIPRRLFPSSPDSAVREKLEQSIVTHCGIDLHPVVAEDRPKSPHRRTTPAEKTNTTTSPTDRLPLTVDRDHQTHSAASSAVVMDEDDEPLPPRPIERERKPYSAQPGGGKKYNEASDSRHPPVETAPASAKTKEFLASPTSASGHRASHSYGQELPYIRSAAGSASAHPLPLTKSGRTRSSSVGVGGSGDYRHSEGDLLGRDSTHSYVGLTPTGAYQSTSSASALPGDVIEDSRRYRDYDHDEGRVYDSLRDRERERDRERRYNDHLPNRSTWSDEDYYRGLLGGQGGGPASGNSSGGYDYKTSWSGYR